MNACDITYNRATVDEILAHFHQCDASFIDQITARIALETYAKKIGELAWRTEAWHGNALTGLVAAYFDEQTFKGFITNVSVLPYAQQYGLGNRLFRLSIQQLTAMGAAEINLEVDENNVLAQRLYRKHGFTSGAPAQSKISMTLYREKTL